MALEPARFVATQQRSNPSEHGCKLKIKKREACLRWRLIMKSEACPRWRLGKSDHTVALFSS
jgi:hypothetical protein